MIKSFNKNLFSKIIVIISIIFLSSPFFSCEEQVDPNPPDQIVDPQDTTNIIYAPDGKGYLKTKTVPGIETEKKFLHLEGSAYEMGYQHGYLLGESVEKLTTGLDLYAAVLFSLSGEQAKNILGDSIIQFLLDTFFEMCEEREYMIPEEYREEMHGIVDGATAAGYTVEYKYLLLNNMAFDVLLGIGYPIVTPFIPLVDPFLEVPHMCDGFVVHGEGTVDGRTLMGRNWMFTEKVLREESLIIEYVPDDGYKLVTPSLPAWVGLTVGMNSEGIGIGMDMVPSIDTEVDETGMGTILLARQVLQHAGELDEALNMYIAGEDPYPLRDDVYGSYLGVSWAVIIGDGKGPNIGSAVVETSADEVMFRYSDWEFPAFYADWESIPKQQETKDDLVVAANHWIIPYKSVWAGDADMGDSNWRYDTLLGLIMAKYGNIDVQEGRRLVDYLHPPNYEYYGTDPTQPVGGSRTLFDLTNLEFWSLFGDYDDPWVHYKF